MTIQALPGNPGILKGITILMLAFCPGGGPDQETAKEAARRLLDQAGVRGGLVVHVGCGDGKLTAALGGREGFLVHGLDADEENVAAARRHIRSAGLYGRVSVDRLEGPGLPYADNLVTLLVADRPGGVPRTEVERVLSPGGVALLDGRKTVKPRPDDIDDWTHYLHDAGGNPVSRDRCVSPPRHLQWDAGPRWSRSHETDVSVTAPVASQGRLFYFLDEGPIGIHETPAGTRRFPDKASLAARDAFNGLLLWKRPVPGWGSAAWDGNRWRWGKGDQLWSSPLTLPRRLVASGDRLYATLGYRAPLSELDAATGRTRREFEGTDSTEEVLLAQGILVLRVRDIPVRPPAPKPPPPSASPETVMAIDAASGKVLWRKSVDGIAALTLAASGGRVFFNDYKDLVALDLKTGDERWRTPRPAADANTLLVHKEVVLFARQGTVWAFSADRGRELWKLPVSGSFRGPPDAVVAGGEAWLGGFKLYDLATGKLAREIDPGHLLTGGHHARCHRARATEDFILYSKRGVEFIDLKSNRHLRHDWVRGTCRYGILPANGLLYAPPHPCFCYPGVKLAGFNALSARDGTLAPGRKREPHATRGPAYGNVPAAGKPSAADWPTYRGDNARSGCARTILPPRLKRAWKTMLQGKVSPPVLAEGRLFVAEPENHSVHCLDAGTGDPLWHVTVGGPVDSPPTIHGGRVLFGSTDGSVYCLRASDGALAWRFHAAPREKRIVSYDALQSAWPVHGSILVEGETVYFAAGRSSFLDGGIALYGLDVATGEVRHRTVLEGPPPDLERPSNRAHEMDGARNDILVGAGGKLFLTQNVFDLGLKRIEAPTIAKHGARRMDRHLVATGGFLDDSGFDRLFWMYAERWPGLYVACDAPKAGQILVFDGTTTYGLHQFTRRFSRSPYFSPGDEGCELFADDNGNEPVLTEKAARAERGSMSRARPPKWSVNIPVRARALVLAGRTLFLAGPPDVVKAPDPLAALEGRNGGLLWSVSAGDGAKIAEHRLEAPPVFDGLIAGQGKLFVVTADGGVACWK